MSTEAGGLASRSTAWQVLRRVHADEAWSGPVVDAALRRSGLDVRDRSFAANLAYETLRWEGTLDWALSTVLSRPLDQVEEPVLDVLRVGAWQVLYGGTPDRAAVDTAVEVARAEIGQRVTGFVNGVLRNLARSASRLPWPSEDSDRGLGLRTGYADWIVAAARQRFGPDARAVLEAGNAAPGLTLRAVGDRAALLEDLVAAGLDPRPGALAPEAVRVGGGVDPGSLSSVAEGRALIQDEASMVVARAAAAGRTDAGWLALDVAAAPGGKSTHLAQLGGRVVAADVNPGRVRQLASTVDRLGLEGRVLPLVADGSRSPLREAGFDVVVLDAPCSGLGVVRRRPELRWRRIAEDIGRLAALQTRLLEAAAARVAEGGTLLYSVCTWTEEETSGVVAGFALMNGDRFELDAIDVTSAPVRTANDAGIQLAPHTHDTDGMYLARFRRRAAR